ncbi:MAG: lysine--tRNA ligase [Candidatus Competibacterales bacterium]
MAKDHDDAPLDDNKLMVQRRAKLAELRQSGNPFPNDFRRDALAAHLHAAYGALDNEALEAEDRAVAVAGRMMLKRVMGKASFITLKDGSGTLQLYLQRDSVGSDVYQAFKEWDLGDIVGAKGVLFRTQKGELSVRVAEIRLLTKALRPLPDKFHGLTDQELRYRQRYADLIVNDEVRRTFETRSRVVDYIRRFFIDRQFLEVETPMMHPIPGGATARPFITHHNALDMALYLRIAPELYLKRLVVGGLERVFEINRNFRNEGLSTRHNPEFTMLEFYQAYVDYRDFIVLTEELLAGLVQTVLGTTAVSYQGQTLDFTPPFAKLSLLEAVVRHHPQLDMATLQDPEGARAAATALGLSVDPRWSAAKTQTEIFEQTVEDTLVAPTFITAYPAEVSPLARRNDQTPQLADRFELFIAGREIANGFSELNDPEDQAERFRAQAAAFDAGDAEAMHFDADYIRALEYGLPPAAGEGIGIDRLVMWLTASPSIRDVLLFPHLRPE